MEQKAVTHLVAARLRELREQRGWSARELAERCARAGMPALTRSTIAKIESSVRRAITADELAVLAGVFEVDVTELLRRPRPEPIVIAHLREPRITAAAGPDLEARVARQVAEVAEIAGRSPHLVLCSGNLTGSGTLPDRERALSVLTALESGLGLDRGRILIVPGPRDLTRAACAAYFSSCEADDIEPQPPYWPKWRHFAGLFKELYDGRKDVVFDAEQPWSLFRVRELKLVVAGLNSTMAQSHREQDDYGWVGEEQAAWFAERLAPMEQEGWLRIGMVHHAPGRAGAGGLRDSGTLERVLGDRVNMIIYGAGGTPHTAEPGRLFTPPPADDAVELLELTADGLTRWTAAGAGRDPERIVRAWHGTGAVFPSAAPTPSGASRGQAPRPDLDDPSVAPSPRDELLDRIAQVCEARFPNARVRRVSASPAHLLVTQDERGITRQFRVGAVVGEPREADLAAFLRHTLGGDDGFELVYQGPTPLRALRDKALRRGVRLRSFVEFQGLLDLSDYAAAQEQRLSSDENYPLDLYIAQRYREVDRPERGIREDLVGEMIDLLTADQGRFMLLLGDFGRGKTFALRELARRISQQIPHLTPVLIELRALDKAHTVDALFAAHLANHGVEHIDLKAFNYMLKRGRIVLLFDGFDELVTRVTYERAADHLETLLQAAQDDAKIVVASRTQHFKSHGQVLTALGERVGLLPQRRVLSIEDFSPAQVKEYLVNRYHSADRAEERMELLRGIEDLLGLAQNPRMLSFIADLDEERLRAVARAQTALSAADLYREILTTWLSFEEERARGPRGNPVGLSLDELWRAVGTLALRLWETGEEHLRPTELEEVAETLAGMADRQLSGKQTAHAMGAGTLLTRTDEGMFGFIHGSVAEWLVADRVAGEFARGESAPAALTWRVLSQLTVDFLCDLAPRACGEWAAQALRDRTATDVVRTNAMRVTTRMRIPARADLTGAKLRGEDLSQRDLQEVNLSGADLTDAQLVGVNLSRAVLRDAVLAGARLDGARLVGANLRGADLSGARLTDADLRDADIEGSRWTRAALVNPIPRERLIQAPELADAAIVPGRPIELQFAPAAVGVPYGFHVQTSRLPEPLAYSPDGGVVAVGGEDGGVLINDTATGRPLRTLHGHRDRTYAVVYGPRVLVTGSADGFVRVWDSATGSCLHTLAVHPEGVWPLRLSADGALTAAGGADGIVRIWSTTSGKLLKQLPGHTAPVYTAVFAPDGRTFVTGDAGAVIRVWDLATGAIVHTLTGHTGAVFRIGFSPDGTMLVAGDSEGVVRLWDARTGEVHQEYLGHGGRVYGLAFHPGGRMLATGDTDGSVRLWDVGTGRVRYTLSEHVGAVYQVDFSPDGSILVTADSNGAVKLWNPATGQPLLDLSGHRGAVWPFAIRPDGAQLATTSNDGTFRLWETATGRCVTVSRRHGRRIYSVEFSPDGSMLVSSGNDGAVRIWETRSGRLLKKLTGTADRLTSAAFSPAGGRLATTGSDGSISLWQAGTWAFERELSVETDHTWAQAFSPGGELLATANDDDTVRLWDHASGREVGNMAEHRGRVRSIAFSPDGRLVATGCDDRFVRVWHAETATCLAVLPGHTDRVYKVVFSEDGRLLASASNDGTARVWDTGIFPAPVPGSVPERGRDLTGREKFVLDRHFGRLWTADFAPGGRLLATAGDDLVIRIWDPRTGEHLHALTGHTRRIWSVAFSPDGRLLASASDDGTILLWDMARRPPVRRMTLLGLNDGWAALAADGRYKYEGETSGAFWYAVAMCRFEPGELDAHLSNVQRLALDAPI